jgi:hypothetical protein
MQEITVSLRLTPSDPEEGNMKMPSFALSWETSSARGMSGPTWFWLTLAMLRPESISAFWTDDICRQMLSDPPYSTATVP